MAKLILMSPQEKKITLLLWYWLWEVSRSLLRTAKLLGELEPASALLYGVLQASATRFPSVHTGQGLLQWSRLQPIFLSSSQKQEYTRRFKIISSTLWKGTISEQQHWSNYFKVAVDKSHIEKELDLQDIVLKKTSKTPKDKDTDSSKCLDTIEKIILYLKNTANLSLFLNMFLSFLFSLPYHTLPYPLTFGTLHLGRILMWLAHEVYVGLETFEWQKQKEDT